MTDLTVYDTVIIGAGAAGITAAYELIRRGQSVRILEASSVWGGRVRKIDDSFAGFPLDIGAGWIHENDDGGPNAKVLKSIVNNPKVNIATKTAVDDKPFVYFEDGERFESPATGDDCGSDVLDEIFVNSSWYDFFATYIYPTVQNAITYDCAVNLIDYSESNSVYAECDDGTAIQARKAIVTASVEVIRAGIISFSPPIPQSFENVLEKFKFQRVLKGFIKFSKRFYEGGKSFEIYPPFYGDKNGELYMWDASYRQGSSSNILGIFITDRYLDDFSSLTDNEKLSNLLDHIDQVYGGEARANYISHTFKDWTQEPYILGGWSVTQYDTAQYRRDLWTLLTPLGNKKVYFAGEAMPHDEWSSTVPAAALSGQTAACRVLGFQRLLHSVQRRPPERVQQDVQGDR
jgi:monoamine oxidase